MAFDDFVTDPIKRALKGEASLSDWPTYLFSLCGFAIVGLFGLRATMAHRIENERTRADTWLNESIQCGYLGCERQVARRDMTQVHPDDRSGFDLMCPACFRRHGHGYRSEPMAPPWKAVP